jgi:hypothetical protein
MVALPIPIIERTYRAGTSDIVSTEQKGGSPNIVRSASSKQGSVTAGLTAEELESFSVDVMLTSMGSVTGAQVVSELQRLHGTLPAVFISGSNKPEIETVPGRSQLNELPRAVRVVTTFEPHLRQSTVKRLQGLFEQFEHSIGQPKVAVAKEELKAALTDAYKMSVLSPETRNFATGISLLQDFLRPHWSEISPAQLSGINAKLSDLASHLELTPRVLERFYRDLAAVTGGRISIAVEIDDEDSADSSE